MARVTLPKSKNAMTFKLSLAEGVSFVVLELGLRCSLAILDVTSVNRRIAVSSLTGSAIFAFRGVDSGMSIVKLN